MTKKGHQKFFDIKWNFFPKKGHLEIWSEKLFSRPPKVSAKSSPMFSLFVLALVLCVYNSVSYNIT